MKYRLIALIPSRSGSERIKDKNVIKLGKKHLIGHTITEAIKSKLFNYILVSTDSKKYADIAKKYGASVPFLRPKKFAASKSPDFDWVNHSIKFLEKKNKYFDFFFILRPTNPFRKSKTIHRAWTHFKKNKFPDSLRAIELCKQHPEKMWILKSKSKIIPLIKKRYGKQPSYNMQFKSLKKIYVQNASLEISKVSNLTKYKTITGKKIIGFKTIYPEGFDINYNEDLSKAKNIFKN
tara:strand:+ start:4204 stop:4911 length:708 start_codon:yes stop_codon:yes gene_type:complete